MWHVAVYYCSISYLPTSSQLRAFLDNHVIYTCIYWKVDIKQIRNLPLPTPKCFKFPFSKNWCTNLSNLLISVCPDIKSSSRQVIFSLKHLFWGGDSVGSWARHLHETSQHLELLPTGLSLPNTPLQNSDNMGKLLRDIRHNRLTPRGMPVAQTSMLRCIFPLSDAPPEDVIVFCFNWMMDRPWWGISIWPWLFLNILSTPMVSISLASGLKICNQRHWYGTWDVGSNSRWQGCYQWLG